MPFLLVVVQTGKKSCRKFSCSSFKAFFILQIIEIGSHFSSKASVHELDFHWWKVEPSNSLTKRAASFRQIGRRIRYVDVFTFPQKRESWNAKFTFIIEFYLLMFLKSTQGCKKPSKTRAIVNYVLRHNVQTYCNISRTFTAFWSDIVRCPTVISTTDANTFFMQLLKLTNQRPACKILWAGFWLVNFLSHNSKILSHNTYSF